MSAATYGTLIAFFEQGCADMEKPLSQLLTHSVPREGDSIAIAGKEWRVAKVTWAVLKLTGCGSSTAGPAGLAATVLLWDPAEPPGPDLTQDERLEFADGIENMVNEALLLAERPDLPEGSVFVSLSATLATDLVAVLRNKLPKAAEDSDECKS